MKYLVAMCALLVSFSAHATSPVYPAGAVVIGTVAVVTEAVVKSDKDALQKCATKKQAKNGNYNYTVYTKEACEK